MVLPPVSTTMLSQLVVVAILSVAAVAATRRGCPSSLTRDKYLRVYGNNCYRFEVNQKKEFQDAQDYCHQDGGRLALVKSPEINEFIQHKLQIGYGINDSLVWIGLRRSDDGEKWQWQDGNYTEATYDNFVIGDSSKRHRCAAMTPSTGLWYGYDCQSTFVSQHAYNFVCEYPNSQPTVTIPSTPGPTIAIEDCPSGLKRDRYLQTFGDKCYRFEVYTFKDFDSAQSDCQTNGGNLAIVNSKAINTFIYHEITNTYDDFYNPLWIGLRYNPLYENFHWVDGSLLSYDHFRGDEIYEANECVAILPYDGRWKSLQCENKNENYEEETNPFICEYSVSTLSTPITTLTEEPTTNNQTTEGLPTTKDQTTEGLPTTKDQTTEALPSSVKPESGCEPLNCDLDCGLNGYASDPITGCVKCQCDS